MSGREEPTCTTGSVREHAPVPSERPAPDVAQAPADRVGRLDVHDEQLLLEAGRPGEHVALLVEHERVPVEDQLVLAADRVAERDEAGVVARARGEHLLALAVAADVERRGREVDEQLRAGEREIGRGRPGLPHVLADRRPDQRAAVLEEKEVVAGREVAVLVEDAVVREEALAVDRPHLAAGADGAGVEEVAVEVGRADERDDPAGRARDLCERALCGADEARAQEQIFRRVPGGGQLGQEDEIGAGGLCLLDPRDDAVAVSVQVADDGIDLRERKPHRF